MRTFAKACLGFLGVFAAGIGAAQPFLPNGAEFRVNSHTTGADRDPAVAVGTTGQHLVTWWGVRPSGDLADVVGRLYSQNGTPVGDEFLVNSFTTAQQRWPDAAAVAAGEFVVTWSGATEGYVTGQIGARRVGAAGPVGAELQVNTVGGQNDFPAVASGSAGFVVIWQRSIVDDAGYDIYGQRYDSTFQPLGTMFRVNTSTTGVQERPDVATRPDGGFLVVWRSESAQADEILGQLYASSGAPVGAEFKVNETSGNDDRDPEIAGGASEFFVAWTSTRPEPEVRARRYTTAGAAAGSEFRVNDATDRDAGGADVVSHADGGFVTVWEGGISGGSFGDIVGRRWAGDGSALTSDFRVNNHTTNVQAAPRVARNGGRFVVAWESLGQDGSSYGIYAQRYCGSPAGDANGDGAISVADVFYMINDLFAGGPDPVRPADANGDGSYDVSDVFFLINYLFAAGPVPACA